MRACVVCALHRSLTRRAARRTAACPSTHHASRLVGVGLHQSLCSAYSDVLRLVGSFLPLPELAALRHVSRPAAAALMPPAADDAAHTIAYDHRHTHHFDSHAISALLLLPACTDLTIGPAADRSQHLSVLVRASHTHAAAQRTGACNLKAHVIGPDVWPLPSFIVCMCDVQTRRNGVDRMPPDG